MDSKQVNLILESYMFSDIDDEDVKQEIIDRITGLSDDKEVKVEVGKIDSEHENGFSVEVFEHGNWSEYAVFYEIEELGHYEDEDKE